MNESHQPTQPSGGEDGAKISSLILEQAQTLTIHELHSVCCALQTVLLSRIRVEYDEQLQTIDDTTAQLIAERKQWEQVADKLRAVQIPKFVKLNVGGQMFSTSVQNLTRIPNSFFAAMFSGRWTVDPNEEIFIDRSPMWFGLILDYLRGDDSVLEGLSSLDLQRVRREADYYQLSELARLCYRPSLSIISGNVMLEKNNAKATMLKMVSAGATFGIVRSTEPIRFNDEPSDGVAEHQIRICQVGTMLVGLSTPELLTKATMAIYNQCGWFWNLQSLMLSQCPELDSRHKHNQQYGDYLRSGDLITVRINSNREVSFAVNNKDLGIAFALSEFEVQGPFVLSIVFLQANCAVEMLS